VLLEEVIAIDAKSRKVQCRDNEFSYDTLVVTTGAQHQYFGNLLSRNCLSTDARSGYAFVKISIRAKFSTPMNRGSSLAVTSQRRSTPSSESGSHSLRGSTSESIENRRKLSIHFLTALMESLRRR
jgi:hypothetical protein